MDQESRNRLGHIIQSLDKISEYTEGKSLADYERETMVRDAVERRVMIIGEAINHLYVCRPPLLTHRINGYRDTIDARNDLAHEYDREDLVPNIWHATQVFHPVLRMEVEALLNAG